MITSGILTPAQVIALAVEAAGIEPEIAKEIAEDAARKLARCLYPLSMPYYEVVIRSPRANEIEWGTIVIRTEETE